MFDYSMDEYESKNFILFFEENGKNIKVNFANGDKRQIPNTKENKEQLLDATEEQVKYGWRYKEKKQKEKKHARNWIIYDPKPLQKKYEK